MPTPIAGIPLTLPPIPVYSREKMMQLPAETGNLIVTITERENPHDRP
jgi:hypothetical protein